MGKALFHRPSCLFCVSKHLASAQILLDEAELGYPEHRWLAVGHLQEAESESLADYPLFSQKIRCLRIILMGQVCETTDSTPSIIELLHDARLLAEKVNGFSESTHVEKALRPNT